jgi:hypothetical protein
MENKDYTTTILVDQSPAEVYNALNNVRGWWQGEIEGRTTNLNDEFTYKMKEFHCTKQKIIQLIPNEKVVWLVTESSINFVANKNEWLNTTIHFDITQENNQTKLSFTHQGLAPTLECYGGCSGGWQKLINQSLLSLITSGKGVDVF